MEAYIKISAYIITVLGFTFIVWNIISLIEELQRKKDEEAEKRLNEERSYVNNSLLCIAQQKRELVGLRLENDKRARNILAIEKHLKQMELLTEELLTKKKMILEKDREILEKDREILEKDREILEKNARFVKAKR